MQLDIARVLQYRYLFANKSLLLQPIGLCANAYCNIDIAMIGSLLLQPIGFGMSCVQFRIPIDHQVLSHYGVATVSRLLKIIGLFCRIPFLLQGFFVKETYNFKEPTDRSHPKI